MATAEQFVNELGVTAVNAAQLEETLLQKVRHRLTSSDVMYSAQSQHSASCFSNGDYCVFRLIVQLNHRLRRNRVCVAAAHVAFSDYVVSLSHTDCRPQRTHKFKSSRSA